MEKKLVITQYTDPMCIWCYALEPGLRKIDVLLGEQVEFHNVMGMLVSDARQIIGDDAFSEMRFEQVSEGEIALEDVPYSTEALVAYVNRFGKVAAQEIKVMFSLSDEQLDSAVGELAESGLFEKVERGTSYFVSPKRLMACDPATGECKVA